MMVGTIDVGFSPEMQERLALVGKLVDLVMSDEFKQTIAEFAQLITRAEQACARIDAFEQAAAEYPNLVIRCDIDPDELRDRIKALQADFGYRPLENFIAPESPL